MDTSGFYALMVRTGGPGARGISCLVADASTPGLSAAAPEHKMGARASTTAQIVLDGARLPGDRLVGARGQGFEGQVQGDPVRHAREDDGREGKDEIPILGRGAAGEDPLELLQAGGPAPGIGGDHRGRSYLRGGTHGSA